MRHHFRLVAQKAKSEKPELVILETIIPDGDCRAGKDSFDLGKVDTVLAQVRSSFGFIPFITQCSSIV